MMPTSAAPRSLCGLLVLLAMLAVRFLELFNGEGTVPSSLKEAPYYNELGLFSETLLCDVVKHLVAGLTLTIPQARIGGRYGIFETT